MIQETPQHKVRTVNNLLLGSVVIDLSLAIVLTISPEYFLVAFYYLAPIIIFRWWCWFAVIPLLKKALSVLSNFWATVMVAAWISQTPILLLVLQSLTVENLLSSFDLSLKPKEKLLVASAVVGLLSVLSWAGQWWPTSVAKTSRCDS